jgi:hypothetical protein
MRLNKRETKQRQVISIKEASVQHEMHADSEKGWLWTIFSVLSIVMVGAVVYSNTLNASWHFDDTIVVIENWSIRDLEGCLNRIFSGTRGVGFFTFALNYHYNQLNVSGYHVVNIIIHIANALLVYSLVRLTLKTPIMSKTKLCNSARFIALSAGLIFVSHPIQTQAVTYISQRFTSLATLFYLLSLIFFIKARQVNKQGKSFISPLHLAYWCFAFFSGFLAMHTKEIAFTLPVVMILYEFFFIDDSLKSWKKRIIYFLPFVITLTIILIGLIQLVKGGEKPIGDIIGEMRDKFQETSQISRRDYFFTQFNVIVTYIRLLFFPMNQILDYDFPIAKSLFQLPALFSFFFSALSSSLQSLFLKEIGSFHLRSFGFLLLYR